MTDFRYLSLEDLLGLIRVLGVGPVRDLGLLDSAVARPQSSAFGEDAYATLELKAAALLHSLVKNHCLVDGNKRLGWLAATVFVKLNGHECALDDDQAFDLVWDVASRQISLDEIVKRLRVVPERSP